MAFPAEVAAEDEAQRLRIANVIADVMARPRSHWEAW
jgi:hypothetical protein